MADFTALKTAIQNAIKQNGNEEITGNLLQEVLLAIVTTLGDGSINELITALDSEATTRGQADTTLQQNINAEAQARQLADSTLQGGINTAMQAINAINNAIANGCVYAGIATPSSTPASGKVFYLALTAGTYTNYGGLEVPQGINILKNNGSTWLLDSFLGIDDAPTPSSNNLVKSGGLDGTTIKKPNFTNGFIPSQGNFVPNNGYRCSDFLPIELISSIEFVEDGSHETASININFYNDKKEHQLYYSTDLKFWDGVFDLTTSNLSSYKYFRYWFSASNYSIDNFKINWINKKVNAIADTLDIVNQKQRANDIDTVIWTRGYIDSHNTESYDRTHSKSGIIDCDVYQSIEVDNNNISSFDVLYYNKDLTLLSYNTITSKKYTLDNNPNYKYFRISLSWDTPSTASEQFVFYKRKTEIETLEEKLYGVNEIDADFVNGFIDSHGQFNSNGNYCRSKAIETKLVSRIKVTDENATSLNINFFATTEIEGSYYTEPRGYIGSLAKDIDLQALASGYPESNYFVVWFSETDPSVADSSTEFTIADNGDIPDIENDIKDLYNKRYKSPTGLIFQSNCKTVKDFNATDKSNSYENLTSSIIANDGGMTIPFGTGKWTWLNKNIRNSVKTHVIDFIPNSCTAIKIGSMGFHGGLDGINENPYFNIDISNGQLNCSNGQSANFTFVSSGKYRIVLYQEDKHTELSIINLINGTKSSTVSYNGETTGNNGLWYDTWAFNPIDASPTITQYEVFTKPKRPFISIFGDSITVGFYATIVDGINHNKYAYLVGEATEREFTSSGRGGGSFMELFGGTITSIQNLSNVKFDGMLYSELSSYMSPYVMLTMGTNGGGSYAQYKQFVEYVLSLGLTPIVNTLPIRADGGTDENVSYVVSANQNIMQIWKDYNIHGARFDLATSLNNDGHTINADMFESDRIHPNDAGHAAMAARVMIDCPELFD